MPGNFATTTRNALRYLLGTSKVADIDEGFQRLAEDVDTKMASYSQGTFAARPAAGQPNRFYKATDTNELFHDTGTVWELLYTIKGNYSGGTERANETEYEASSTRPVFVVLVSAGKLLDVTVGGVNLASTGASSFVSFICPPGQKWKAKTTSAVNFTSYYLTL